MVYASPTAAGRRRVLALVCLVQVACGRPDEAASGLEPVSTTGSVATTTIASPPADPDLRPPAARGFDFLYGSWDVENRVLRERLSGSTDWDVWKAELDVVPILFGMGQMDRFRAKRDGQVFEGSTLRLYDPADSAWNLYWMDTSGYRLLPQVSGPMGPEGGTFYGEEEFGGRTVNLRFRWMHSSPDSADWDQAYQTPEGDWEINWTMEFTRR